MVKAWGRLWEGGFGRLVLEGLRVYGLWLGLGSGARGSDGARGEHVLPRPLKGLGSMPELDIGPISWARPRGASAMHAAVRSVRAPAA